MHAHELIEVLKALDPNTPVILASDEDGSSFHLVYSVDPGYVDAGDLDNYAIDSVYIEEEDDDGLEDDEFSDFIHGKTKVAVIWP